MAPAPVVQLAVSKIPKYATRESGDTVEVVERPHGGLSAVLADGQRSGRSAKNISNLVVRKAISLLAEGVRDGATARAAHDYLRTYRRGQVSAELQIVSIDMDSWTLVISRNCHCPAWFRTSHSQGLLQAHSQAIGIHRNTRPDITELPIEAGSMVVAASDGVWEAGRHPQDRMNLPALVCEADPDGNLPADRLARLLLDTALVLEEGRARDDLTVLVMKVLGRYERDDARHMTVSFPLG